MIAVCVFLGLVATAVAEEKSPITFKRVDDYEEIWTDAGSKAYSDGSYWRPKALAYDFFPLGDYVQGSHSKPTMKAVLVKENEPGALKQPASFTEIWNDKGSGAYKNVKVMKMNPPQGYTCLGNVAVNSYSATPDGSKYRCVKTEYVAVGGLTEIWNDAGSKAYKDVASWRVVRGSDVDVQEAGTFISIQAHSKPTETPYILDSDYAKELIMLKEPNRRKQSTSDDDFPIKLYKTSDIQQIWTDAGSKAYSDFSCSRAMGPGETFSLGDIPLNSHGVPMYGVVAKSVEDDALQAPYDYMQIWNDKGSGAYKDGAFWEPLCSGGYVAVGSVCTGSHSKPGINEVRCVKETHVATGKWMKIWTDAGSKADKDVSVFQAEDDGPNQQRVEALGAVQKHTDTMPSDKLPYVLIGDHTIMIDGKPAKGYYLTNVQYDLDQTEILNQDPAYLATTTVENHGNTTQTTTRTLSSEWSESRDWSSMTGIESSVETTTQAGVPLVAEASVTVGVVSTFEYQSGGSVTETMTDSIEAAISVLPHCQKTVDMVGVNYVADVPFIADVRTEYEDGTTGFRYAVEGVYYGTNIGDRRVVYGPDIPLE